MRRRMVRPTVVLSTAGLTDQPERLTGLDPEAHTIDRADLIHHPLEDAAANREVGLEIVDLEQRACCVACLFHGTPVYRSFPCQRSGIWRFRVWPSGRATPSSNGTLVPAKDRTGSGPSMVRMTGVEVLEARNRLIGNRSNHFASLYRPPRARRRGPGPREPREYHASRGTSGGEGGELTETEHPKKAERLSLVDHTGIHRSQGRPRSAGGVILAGLCDPMRPSWRVMADPGSRNPTWAATLSTCCDRDPVDGENDIAGHAHPPVRRVRRQGTSVTRTPARLRMSRRPRRRRWNSVAWAPGPGGAMATIWTPR